MGGLSKKIYPFSTPQWQIPGGWGVGLCINRCIICQMHKKLIVNNLLFLGGIVTSYETYDTAATVSTDL